MSEGAKGAKGSSPAPMRRFLFRATGADTDAASLGPIDLYDNLVVELDRLSALAELLACSGQDLDVGALGGVAALMKDVEERMREILKRSISSCRGPSAARSGRSR